MLPKISSNFVRGSLYAICIKFILKCHGKIVEDLSALLTQVSGPSLRKTTVIPAIYETSRTCVKFMFSKTCITFCWAYYVRRIPPSHTDIHTNDYQWFRAKQKVWNINFKYVHSITVISIFHPMSKTELLRFFFKRGYWTFLNQNKMWTLKLQINKVLHNRTYLL